MPYKNKLKKHQAFVYLLLAVIFISAYFAWYNIAEGTTSIALFESSGIIFSIIFLIIIFKTSDRTVELIKRLYTIFLLAIISYSIWFLPFDEVTVYSWLYIIPPLSYFLIDKKWGFRSSLALLLLNAAFAALTTSHMQQLLTIGAISDILLTYSIIWLLSHGYQQANDAAQDKLQKQACLDNLTGLYNRRLLKIKFEEAMEKSMSTDTPVCLALIDIDFFKRVNDSLGHEAGDNALIHVAQVVKKSLRRQDEVFRIGGEEFCVLIPNSSLPDAIKLCERIRISIEENPAEINSKLIPLTVSIGAAERSADQGSLTKLLRQADICMYQAKNAGRNRVAPEINLN